MNNLFSLIDEEIDNMDGLGFTLSYFYASGLPAIIFSIFYTSLLFFLKSDIGIIFYFLFHLIFVVLNLRILFYGNSGNMRGNLSKLGKIILILLSILFPYIVFLSLIVYIFIFIPILQGKKLYHIFLFLFNPPLTVLLWIGLVAVKGSTSEFFYDIFDKWHPAVCSNCGKDMKIELLIKKPLCGDCLEKIYGI